MAARCRKFVPNLFNKSKCQSCFGAKESHSAEALESSKAARKISKCSYLFVAPDLDFSNPLHRTRRWQRRFFILYDDGELTYSVDDNPGTIPQGCRDMNICTDVFEAEEATGHEYSIGIVVPNNLNLYVKGDNKEEIGRWFDVLVMYPRSLTIKTKRVGGKAGSPAADDTDEETMGAGISRHHSFYPSAADKQSISDDEDGDSVHSKDSETSRNPRSRGRYKQRDMRRSKSEVRPSDLRQAEDEFNTRKARESSPAFSLSLKPVPDSKPKTRADGVDAPARRAGEPETFTSVRSMKHRKARHTTTQDPKTHAPPPQSAVTSVTATVSVPLSTASRRLSNPNIAVAKLAEQKGVGPSTGPATLSAFVFPPNSGGLIDANETDEHKLAKSEHARKSISLEKAPIVRKGWLVKQDGQSKSWSKHWFVLCGTTLAYYNEAKAEESSNPDGAIDIGNAYEVTTIKAERNHGFKIKTREGEYVLSAMTSGIRKNWMEAIESIIGNVRRAEEKSARQDMGFVFEPPMRSPRVTSSPAASPLPQLAPVVPNSGSRINSALRLPKRPKPREVAQSYRETGDDTPLDQIYETRKRPDSVSSETENEVSSLTSLGQEGTLVEPASPAFHTDNSPRSPSAFVSPSQRIKEKTRAKTPPRARSPPPPPVTETASAVTPQRLLPSGSSSDENDESLTAKLLEAQREVQHLQQHVQDVNSTVRKQRVEIESLQTKLELTSSQLHDMETALTHSAQNLNKERKHVARLNEALKTAQNGQEDSFSWKEKCAMLEQQLQDATMRLADQEVRMSMVKSMEEQLQIRTSKLATLEKVLTNTRRHLQDAVENVRETELQYQAKIEEMEQEYEEERIDHEEKMREMQNRLELIVMQSKNCVNTGLTNIDINPSDLVKPQKDKTEAMQRLEELVKEQKGKLEQLTEDHSAVQTEIQTLKSANEKVEILQEEFELAQTENAQLKETNDALQAMLDSVRVELDERNSELAVKRQESTSLLATIDELQNKCRQLQQADPGSGNWSKERQNLREELEAVTAELNTALEASQKEIADMRQAYAKQTTELANQKKRLQAVTERCGQLEKEVETLSKKPPEPSGFQLPQVMSFIEAVIRSCERMTESTVAMLAGEMIETDIKATLNLNQDQRAALGTKSIDTLQKKMAGVRQRLNYIVKHSASKKLLDAAEKEREECKKHLEELEGQLASCSVSDSASPNHIENMSELGRLLQLCRTEILCITSDLTRLDISHIEEKLKALSSAIESIEDRDYSKITDDHKIVTYCELLALQSAAMFELTRCSSQGFDIASVLSSIENSLKTTSGTIKNIEDLAVRNTACLVAERLVLTYELDRLTSHGCWQGSENTRPDAASTAMLLEALQRFNITAKQGGDSLMCATSQNCLSVLLYQTGPQNISQQHRLLGQTSFLKTIMSEVNSSLRASIKSHCAQYTCDLVNFGVITFSDVEVVESRLLDSLCSSITHLVDTGQLSLLSSEWLHTRMCEACQEIKGIELKEMSTELAELALKHSLLQTQFNTPVSLLDEDLMRLLSADAIRLAGLSQELMTKSALPGSTEERIIKLAERLMENEQLLAAQCRHYGDSVYQVMREVVYGLQNCLLRHHLTSAKPPTLDTKALAAEIEELKLQLTMSREKKAKLLTASTDSATLRDEMNVMKFEHSKELEESKRDMRMVLKSVKAEEAKLATDLTEEINALKSEVEEERRRHAAEMAETRAHYEGCDQQSVNQQAQLKDKIRDLENCLHEMQEEFEEELYQERQHHLTELENIRFEKIELLAKVDNKQLSGDETKDHYEAIIGKLQAEQTSLQQWIDDIREAHKDEIDALVHEKEMALADEVANTRAALEALQSAHEIQINATNSKLTELQTKVSQLLEVQKDHVLLTHETQTKDKRISGLEERMATTTHQIAKLELESQKQTGQVAELREQNQRLSDRNKLLVEQFSKEISQLQTGQPSDASHVALRAQVETMTEQLLLEQLDKRQLEERIELMKTTQEKQLKQREEAVRAELKSEMTDESVYRRKMRGRSPSPHSRRSSPPVLALSHSSSVLPLDMSQPRKTPDKAYDLSRSRSSPVVGKPLSRSAGGVSLADRMKKFNA